MQQELLEVAHALDPIRLLHQLEQLQQAIYRFATGCSPFLSSIWPTLSEARLLLMMPGHLRVPEVARLVHATPLLGGHRRPHPRSGHAADPPGAESPLG